MFVLDLVYQGAFFSFPSLVPRSRRAECDSVDQSLVSGPIWKCPICCSHPRNRTFFSVSISSLIWKGVIACAQHAARLEGDAFCWPKPERGIGKLLWDVNFQRCESQHFQACLSVCWLWVAGFHFILGIVAMWDIYNFVKCWKIKVTLCNIAGLNSLFFFGNASCSLGTGEELKTEAQTA